MLKIPRELVLSLLYVVIISMLAIVLNMPSQTPYSPYNTGSKGYSKLLSSIPSIEIVRSLDHIEPSSVVIIPLTKEVSSSTSVYLKNLTSAGATIVILDEEGCSNKLLEDLGLEIKIRKAKVLDEVSKHGSREYPVITIGFNSTTFKVVAHKPSYIEPLEESSEEIVGSTSDYAYVDEDGNSFYTLGEVMRRHIVIYSTSLNTSSLWVIADLDILSNRVIDYLDNKRFIETLTSSRKTYIVLEGLDIDLFDIIKYVLTKGVIGAYGGVFVFPLVFMVLLMIYIALEHYM